MSRSSVKLLLREVSCLWLTDQQSADKAYMESICILNSTLQFMHVHGPSNHEHIYGYNHTQPVHVYVIWAVCHQPDALVCIALLVCRDGEPYRQHTCQCVKSQVKDTTALSFSPVALPTASPKTR